MQRAASKNLLDPEKPGPCKTWTQKNLDPENNGPKRNWTLEKMNPGKYGVNTSGIKKIF